MTPEEKLCSRSWRLRNSSGLLWSILSFDFLTGVGFLVRGMKAKNKLWTAMGIGFLIVGIGLLVSTGTFETRPKGSQEPLSAAANIWGWIWFTTFIGGVVTAFITNRKWLVWKAHTSDVKWYAQAATAKAGQKPAPVRGFDPNAAAAAFASQSARIMLPTPDAAAVLDINSASAQELSILLGVDDEMANRIIGVRQSLASFTSFEQLMSKALVPPHLLIPHRAKMTFGTPPSANTSQPEHPSSSSKSARKLFD